MMKRHIPDIRRIEVVDEAIAAILRPKTPAERLAMAFECNRTVRRVIEGSLRTFHPDWRDEEIMAEVARRMLSGSA